MKKLIFASAVALTSVSLISTPALRAQGTPEQLAHHAYTSGDPTKLSLEDKERILANGSADDAKGLWALLKGQVTPVPGVVIEDPASVLRITITATASIKPKVFMVNISTPVDCSATPEPPSELHVKEAHNYIVANGVMSETDAMGDALTETPAHIRSILIETLVSAVDVAISQDAKGNHVADFIVNLKDPVSCKDAPGAGSVLGLQPATEVDGTYDSYTHTAATGTTGASVQIILTGGFLKQEQKAAPAHHDGM
jgi:hypothetical protein